MKNREVEQQQIKMQKRLNEYAIKNGYPPEDYKFVAIGYLAWGEPFEKGEVSNNFLTKLKVLWNEGGTSGSLGHHDCEFCIDEGIFPRGQSSSEKVLIDRENKIKYLFPEMIFHYITEHKFKPSNEFIYFVMRS